MLLVPIGHEDQTARRWPWITIGIIVINIIVFALTLTHDASLEGEAGELYIQLQDYYQKHPYLEVPESAKALLAPDSEDETESESESETEAEDGSGWWDPAGKNQMKSAAEIREEQEFLDDLAVQLDETVSKFSSRKYGYRPGAHSWRGLFTHMFLHGGFLHIGFNLWFLWLVGCNVEDRWGRIVFPLFYLSAGVAAALTHKLGVGQSMTPMIGASGAVAGAMGAFLVLCSKTRIRFMGWVMFKPFFFNAPAYLMLPLWVLSELLSALMDANGQGGVAYWAHVGGFAYGAAFALALRHTGLERKLDAVVSEEERIEEDPALKEAWALSAAGKYDEALTALQALPATTDTLAALAEVSLVAGRLEESQRAKARLVEMHLRGTTPDAALPIYQELVRDGYRSLVAPALRLRLARGFERTGNTSEASVELQHLYEAPAEIALPAVLAQGNIALKLGQKSTARALFQYAEQLSATHPNFDAAIREGLHRCASESVPPAA